MLQTSGFQKEFAKQSPELTGCKIDLFDVAENQIGSAGPNKLERITDDGDCCDGWAILTSTFTRAVRGASAVSVLLV